MPEVQEVPANCRRRRRGQGLVEYALILVLVAVVVVLILPLVGNAIASVYTNIICQLDPNSCPSSEAGCASESVSLNATCSGNNLTLSASSSCAGASLTLNPPSPITNGCPGGVRNWFNSVTVRSTHPDGTVKTYTIFP